MRNASLFVSAVIVLLVGCIDPVSEGDVYNNPFDPAHPDSPFNQEILPQEGIEGFSSVSDSVAATVAWTPVQDAVGYQVQWDTEDSFASASAAEVDVPEAAIEVQTETTVFWRVRFLAEAVLPGESSVSSDWSPWHGPWSFDVDRSQPTIIVDLPQQPGVIFEGQPITISPGTDFTVTAEASQADTYSWYLDGTPVGTGESVTLGSALTTGPYELTVVIEVGSEFYSESMTFAVESDGGVAPDGQVASPNFDPSPGTYAEDFAVTLSSITAGASIYYTTDGSTPSSSSTLYTGPINVSGDGTALTIKAIAVNAGMTNSYVTSADYSVVYTTEGSFVLDLPEQPAVSFQGQPVAVPQGSDFTVTAEASQADSFSWYLGGTPVGTGESATLGSALTTGPYELTVVIGIGSEFYSESIPFVVES